MRSTLPLFLAMACTTAAVTDDGDSGSIDPTCLDADVLRTESGDLSCAATAQLCDPDVGACVDPWRYGAPAFDACSGDPDITTSTLADKAAVYDHRAATLHVHPDLGWMMGVQLDDEADPATATYEDVAVWRDGENDGLWSSLYLASQAFRYASTTGDERAEALAMVKTLLDGEVTRMDVSGAPGNLVRQYVPPGIDGLDCPADLEKYRVDVEKDDNRWVRIDDDGCIEVVPTDGDDFVVTDTCPGTDFAGWCFLDNTSKDEYAGHMFALGAVLKLVDDPEAKQVAGDLIAEVVDAFLDNDLWMIDHDGRRTEHGDASPLFGGGFNGAMFLGWLTMAAEGLDDERFDVARDCLTRFERGPECPDIDPNPSDRFQDTLPLNAVHLDKQGCLSNDNNASMFMLSLANLLWWDTDAERRALYQVTLRDIWEADTLRALGNRENAWYDMMWAAFKPLGPDSDGPATAAVEDAACGLAVFPDDEVRREVAPFDTEQICLDRLDRPMGAVPRGPHERCLEAFVWWKDQYILKGCDAAPTIVESPGDYLLPYWMGRYFGFVKPGW